MNKIFFSDDFLPYCTWLLFVVAVQALFLESAVYFFKIFLVVQYNKSINQNAFDFL